MEQAAFGAREGGLGLRRSADMRLPAFLASRVESRGLAASLASSLIHQPPTSRAYPERSAPRDLARSTFGSTAHVCALPRRLAALLECALVNVIHAPYTSAPSPSPSCARVPACVSSTARQRAVAPRRRIRDGVSDAAAERRDRMPVAAACARAVSLGFRV